MMGLGLVVLVWELVYRVASGRFEFFPPPTVFIGALLVNHLEFSVGFERFHMAEAMLASTIRIVVGFSVAALLGLVVAMGCSLCSALDLCIRPIASLMMPVPPLAWLPLAISLFGISEPAAQVVIVLSATPTLYMIAIHAIDSVPPCSRRSGSA
jgi:NitT/TauT family transport system permease protein